MKLNIVWHTIKYNIFRPISASSCSASTCCPTRVHRCSTRLSCISLMHYWVSDLLTYGDEGSLGWRHLVIRLCKRSLSVVWLVLLDQTHWVLPLILNDHVVQGHTTIHHFPHLIFRPSHSREPDKCKHLLEHTKCPLHALPASFLFLGILIILEEHWV
jgi:hypothetical protein